MADYTANTYTVRVSPEVYINLERWAYFQKLDINEAANQILKRFLKHQEFYVERKPLSFYTHPTKVKILQLLNVGGANLGYIARKIGRDYGDVKRHLEALKLAGVVVERRYGKRIRFFQLNIQNEVTRQLLKMLNLWFEPDT